MRQCVWFFALALAASSVPAFAQFGDLIQQAETLQIPQDQKVTLDLRRVPAKDAVAKLAEASQTTLTCSAELADRLVTLIARDQSAKQVGTALARAVRGQWKSEEKGFSLQPVEPLQVLTPAELAAELQAAFLNSNVPTGYEARQATRQILTSFSAAQIGALMSRDGLAGSQFSPQQRQQIALLLGSRVARSLEGLPREYGMADAADQMTVRMVKNGSTEMMVVSGGGRTITLPMRASASGRGTVRIQGEAVMR